MRDTKNNHHLIRRNLTVGSHERDVKVIEVPLVSSDLLKINNERLFIITRIMRKARKKLMLIFSTPVRSKIRPVL